MLLLAPLGAGAQALRGTFSAGGSLSLSIHGDGSLWATGDNTYGQLGTGTTSTTSSTTWVRVGTDLNWVQVSAGNSHSLGLKADGTAYAWGLNSSGQLGDGTTTNRSVPTLLSATDRYTQLVAGYYSHSLGLRADGTAYAWGYNSNGALGDGTTTNRLIPTLVSGGATYT